MLAIVPEGGARYAAHMQRELFIDDMGDVMPIPEHAAKVFQGTVYSVWQWEQEQFDGSLGTWEGLKRNHTAHTVGVLPEGKILLTLDEQPGRHAVLTPPGGHVDEDEEPEAAAKREFLEETGYSIGTLIPWHYYRASTSMEWCVYAYVGRDLKRVGEPQLEAGERVSIQTFTFEEFLELGRLPVRQAGTPLLRDRILRIILLEAMLDPVKKEQLHQIFYG